MPTDKGRYLMSQAMLEALDGLGEADTYAVEFDASFGRADEVPPTVCACCCCVVCTGVVIGAEPVSVESKLAA